MQQKCFLVLKRDPDQAEIRSRGAYVTWLREGLCRGSLRWEPWPTGCALQCHLVHFQLLTRLSLPFSVPSAPAPACAAQALPRPFSLWLNLCYLSAVSSRYHTIVHCPSAKHCCTVFTDDLYAIWYYHNSFKIMWLCKYGLGNAGKSGKIGLTQRSGSSLQLALW